jgi:hypothetical protein
MSAMIADRVSDSASQGIAMERCATKRFKLKNFSNLDSFVGERLVLLFMSLLDSQAKIRRLQ